MTTAPERPSKPRRRRVWAIALLAMTVIAIVATWRLTSLDGLPDVGDPFDVAAFADVTVSDDRNAFTLYRQATILLTQPPKDATDDWATAGTLEKRWLEANREALDIWRRGTERPDALYIPPRTNTFATMLPVIQELRTLALGACLEGSRLEAVGDLDGALTWYVAMLRSGRHCGTRGVMIERLVGMGINQTACRQINRWATDSRVDAAMLRRAIDSAIAAEAMTRPTSEAFKVEYLGIMNSIDDPKVMTPEVLSFATGEDGSRLSKSPILKAIREDFPKMLLREPERTRRVVRLVFANQLAYCDLPIARQPKKAATLPTDSSTTRLYGELYAVDPSAPAAARALPPAEIARWWNSSLYARLCMTYLLEYQNTIAREQTLQATLLANLRAELEKREHPQPVGAKAGVDRP